MYLTVKDLKAALEECDNDQIVLITTDWANSEFSKLGGIANNQLYDKEAEEQNQGWGMGTIVHDLEDTGYDEDNKDWLEIKNRGLKAIVLH
jgi:hypothetical protein